MPIPPTPPRTNHWLDGLIGFAAAWGSTEFAYRLIDIKNEEEKRMATATRIYAVKSGDAPVRLIRASNKAQAVAHVARKTFTAELPTQEALIEAGKAGIAIEEAKDEAE